MKRIWTWPAMLALVLALSFSMIACGGDDDDDDDDNDDGDDDDNGDDDDDEQPACVDEDGDGFGENCDAGPDCNDVDPDAWQVLTGYTDADGDGYPGTEVEVCSGDLLPVEYFTFADDCDDGDAMVNPAAVELPDDGIDQDCDGDDLTASDANGVFVDEAADPGGDGSMANPFQTVADGITEAESKADGMNVYIAAGTYTEDILTASSLFGGYDGSDWSRDIVNNVTEIEPDTVPAAVSVAPLSVVVLDGLTLTGATGGANSYGVAANGATIQVSRSAIVSRDATNTSAGVFAASGTVWLYDTEIQVGVGDTTMFGFQVNASYFEMHGGAIDIAGSAGAAAYCAVGQNSSVILSGFDCTTGDVDDVYGLYFLGSDLSATGLGISLGDTDLVSSGFGAQLANSSAHLEGNSFTLADSSTGSVFGLFLSDTAGTLFGNTVVVGEAPADSNFGAMVNTGTPLISVVLANNSFVVGDAMSTSFAFQGSGYMPQLFNNTFVGGDADTAMGGLFAYAGFQWGPVPIVNNVFAAGNGSTNEYATYFAGPPLSGVLMFHNDLFGPSPDCLLYDNGDCLTDLADVNACGWDACLDAGGNVDDDPDFVSGSDVHLQGSSALVDAGANPLPFDGVLGGQAWIDIDRDPRPLGSTWDIGADEVDAK